MNAELKAMLEKLTTDELDEVLEVVSDLVSIKTDEESAEDDGQPSEQEEQADFAQDEMIPYEPIY